VKKPNLTIDHFLSYSIDLKVRQPLTYVIQVTFEPFRAELKDYYSFPCAHLVIFESPHVY
jgi:hypothetical protein